MKKQPTPLEKLTPAKIKLLKKLMKEIKKNEAKLPAGAFRY